MILSFTDDCNMLNVFLVTYIYTNEKLYNSAFTPLDIQYADL